MTHQNLLAGPTPPPTYLPENHEAAAALSGGADPASVAARFPAFCAAWADLAERALAQRPGHRLRLCEDRLPPGP